jgi:hypothetical protein
VTAFARLQNLATGIGRISHLEEADG